MPGADRARPADATGTDAARRAVEAVWRIESARIVGALTRYTGDFELAEDVAQEALAEALAAWPRAGVPDKPGAWLLTTARRRALDAFRRHAGRDERYAALARELAHSPHRTDHDVLWDPDAIHDDLLALVFTSCHPVLSRDARIVLTLRTVGGLTSEEIARAFLVPVATVRARITRAKKSLAAARVPFAVPSAGERGDRLASVLNVVYLIFTEGSSATSGDDWIRHDLAREALRLARVVVNVEPAPEAYGLVALLELTAARFLPGSAPAAPRCCSRTRTAAAGTGRPSPAAGRRSRGRPGPTGSAPTGSRRRSRSATTWHLPSPPPIGSASCSSTKRCAAWPLRRWST